MRKIATLEDDRDICCRSGLIFVLFLPLSLPFFSLLFDVVSSNTSWQIIVAIIVSSFLFHWHHNM